MIRNYFFLNRFTLEAAGKLQDKTVLSIFSQEKDRLLFELGDRTESLFLEISVDPGDPFLNIREKYARARKNTINFFPDFLNKKIESIEIADDDRIIKIMLGNDSVYFTIRGKYTNVIAVSNDEKISTFKKIDYDELILLKNELTGKKYTTDYNIPDFSIGTEANYQDEIRKRYPVIGKEIIHEVQRRSRSTSAMEFREILISVLNEIKEKNPAVFINDRNNTINLAVDSFGIFEHQQKKVFDDLISAQSFYLSKRYFLDEKDENQKILQNHIDKELKKVSNKINKLTGVVEKGSNEEAYRKYGNLLLISLNKIRPGMHEITLEDIYSSQTEITIKLNRKLSSKKNADWYFEKAKSERKNYDKSRLLLKQAELDYNKLKTFEQKLSTIDESKELKSIMKELRIKGSIDVKEKDDLRTKFKHYIIENKFNVYVGKDSKNNDLLTTRFAKQNDYWFHARGSSGSHVVLRVENTKEPVPKSVLKKTASLAAYHSKSKTSGLAPVAFTFKKYVVKKKGDPIGTVHLLREDVLLVKPEIPAGCEYVSFQSE